MGLKVQTHAPSGHNLVKDDFAQDLEKGKSIKRPKPSVMSVRPHQRGGRYLPVFFMRIPVPAVTKENEIA